MPAASDDFEEEEKVADASRDSSRMAQEYDERQFVQHLAAADGKGDPTVA